MINPSCPSPSLPVIFAIRQVCLISNNTNYEPRGGLPDFITWLGLIGRKWVEIVEKVSVVSFFLIAVAPLPLSFYNVFL